MAKSGSPGSSEDKPDKDAKFFSVQAEAADGMTVTLGRYQTEEEARRDQARFEEEAYYMKIKVVPIEKPEPAE